MIQSDMFTLATAIRVLRLRDVVQRTGLSRSTLYGLMDSKSKYYDPTFPHRIHLTAKVGGAIGFIESEVSCWIASRIAA